MDTALGDVLVQLQTRHLAYGKPHVHLSHKKIGLQTFFLPTRGHESLNRETIK